MDILKDFWARGEPIPWVRIYKVADHVKFPHMRHVAADADHVLELQRRAGAVLGPFPKQVIEAARIYALTAAEFCGRRT